MPTISQHLEYIVLIRTNIGLDDKTLRGLDGLSEEDRSSILDDLISKSDVRNPSAFVYRAVTNLQHRRAPPVTS